MSESIRTVRTETTLSKNDRLALQGLVHQPGWKILKTLMEMKCILQDNILIGVPVHEKDKILAEHSIAVAKWEFFSSIVKQVEYEVNELTGANQKTSGAEDEQTSEANILDPLK